MIDIVDVAVADNLVIIVVLTLEFIVASAHVGKVYLCCLAELRGWHCTPKVQRRSLELTAEWIL